MGSDSIRNDSVLAFSGKKKKTNRLAKLKQCKLDARREQWLSHVKNKGSKEGLDGGIESPISSLHLIDETNPSLINLEIRSKGDENDGSSFHDSDLESMANSPTSSVMGGSNDSRKEGRGSGGIGCSSSSGCCSESVSEEEEEDDGCLDDWEAIADALNMDDKRREESLDPIPEPEPILDSVVPELPNRDSKVGILNSNRKPMILRQQANGRAWRSDDAFRPQDLPNLSKQHSFPVNLERHCGHGAVTPACHSIISQPSPCPICYEDLDVTDSSFLPCSCGFCLCLFCHKKILEADGRCPGCRKQYDPISGKRV